MFCFTPQSKTEHPSRNHLVLQAVDGNILLERLRQRVQILRRPLGLARAGQRLRGRLPDRAHRLPNLHHPGGLLLRRRRDLHARLRSALDLGRDPVDHLPGLPGQLAAHLDAFGAFLGHQHRRVGGLLDLTQDLAHLPGCALGAFGQLAHVLGHHREALALLAGPRGLDRRVER